MSGGVIMRAAGRSVSRCDPPFRLHRHRRRHLVADCQPGSGDTKAMPQTLDSLHFDICRDPWWIKSISVLVGAG